jgi:hypothetical protein
MADELIYHQQTVALLDPIPRVSPEALAAMDERERALGIRIPASVREWYSLEGAVELLETYSNDDHPVRLAELGEPDWDWHAFREHLKPRVAESDWDAGEPEWQGDALAGNPLVFMNENQACCRWAVPLEQANDPVVLVQNDAMLGWRKVSDRFSSFVYSYIWNYRYVHFATCILEAKGQSVTPSTLGFMSEHYLQAATTHVRPDYDLDHRHDHYRFMSRDGSCRILIEDVSSGWSNWHLASDALLDFGYLATTLRHQGAFRDGVAVRMRCRPGLSASWHLDPETSPLEPETLGQLVARLGRLGRMGRIRGPFDWEGNVALSDMDRRRVRFYACLPDDEEDTLRPLAPPKLNWIREKRQRGSATDG